MEIATCEICAKEKPLVEHHVKPVSSGGDNEDHNIMEICKDCHVHLHSENNDFRKWGYLGGKSSAKTFKWIYNLKCGNRKPTEEDIKLRISKLSDNDFLQLHQLP